MVVKAVGWFRSLLDRPSLRSVAYNTLWLVFERLYRLGMSVMVSAWIARYLGPDHFGKLAYAVAVVALFLPFAQLGMTSVLVKEFVQRRVAAGTILGTSFLARMLAGCGSWVAAILFVWIVSGDWQAVMVTAIIGAQLLFQASDVFDLWFQANNRNRLSVISRLAATTITSGIKIALLLAKAPLVAFAVMMAADVALIAVALTLTYRGFPTTDRWRANWREAKSLLAQCWPFIFTSLSIAVYMRIDQIMLESLSTPQELGLFAACSQFSSVWQAVPSTLAISLAPFLARKAEESEMAFYKSLRYVMALLGCAMFVAAAATAIAAPWIVDLFLGPSYTAAAPVLAVLVFTNVFIGLGTGWSLWVVITGRGRLSIVNTLTGCFVSVIGNLLLLPTFGAMGAAIVAVAAQAISSLLINAMLTPRIFLLQLGIMPKILPTAILRK